MVVCDPAQGNEVGGKLSKVEEMIKPSKEKKKKKPNVKYTDRKTSLKPSTATVSSDEGSDISEAETLSSGEEQFSTLTSYDGQKQYRPPDPTKTDAKFGAKKRNPLKSLQEELSKVSKKMTDYQSEINRLNKSLAAQKRKLVLGHHHATISLIFMSTHKAMAARCLSRHQATYGLPLSVWPL